MNSTNTLNTTSSTNTWSTTSNTNTECHFVASWEMLWIPLLVIFSSFIFFRYLQFTVRWYLFGKWTFPTFNHFIWRRRIHAAPNPNNSAKLSEDSSSLEFVPPNKKWRIANEYVSLFHSIMSGAWALAILTHTERYINDVVNARSTEALYLTYISFGYLVHDFVDLVANEQSARIIELLFHHIVVLSAFTITQVTCKLLYIAVFGLLMEVNSIFLHARSLCNLYGVPKKSNLFKMIAVLNVTTFTLFRLVVSVCLIVWVIIENVGQEMPWYLKISNTLLICSLTITNFVLFYRVLAADGLLGKRRATRNKSPSPDGSDRSMQGQQEQLESGHHSTGSDESENMQPQQEEQQQQQPLAESERAKGDETAH